MNENTIQRIADAVADKLEPRFDRIEQRLGAVELRLDGVEHRVGQLENRVGQLENRVGSLEHRVYGLEEEMKAGLDRLGESVVYLANCWPGTMPGRKSHVARQVEKILKPT